MNNLGMQTAVVAAGCFWGVQELLREIPGVLKTEVGYCGGSAEEALYSKVKTGMTEHAEAVRIQFDNKKLSYEKLLELFFNLHDPTTLNQQGNDIGMQYRSAIFYFDEEQKNAAFRVINQLTQSKVFKNEIVTQVVEVGNFFSAEEYHQDYLKKNPNGYMCHYWRKPVL